MAKYLPRNARPVEAFHWKSNWSNNVWELISFLNREGWEFELFANGSGVSILIGDSDSGKPHTYERVDEGEWVVFDGEELYVYKTRSDFDEAYEVFKP